MKKIVTKKNIFLLTLLMICLLGLSLKNTYAKFTSGFTTTEDVVGISLNFDLKISNIEEYEEITLKAGEYQIFNVEVQNGTNSTIYYGIWYKIVAPSEKNDEIIISKLEGTSNNTSGQLTSSQSTTTTIIAKNNSSEPLKINIGVSSSTTSVSDIEYLGGKYLIIGEANQKLAGAKVGSYIKYIGNNGCTGASCSGQNANYVNDTDMGYCGPAYKYNYNGWRIAYINGSNVYLVSAGAPECLCTNSDGTTSNTSCSTYESQSADVVYHLDNLNNQSLKYCNRAFASGNVCDSSSAWSLNKTDYYNILNSDIDSCTNLPENLTCGYQNSLIDNGGMYWFTNSHYDNASAKYFMLMWYPEHENIGNSFVGGTSTNYLVGVRPVIKLDSSVIITGGTGTYKDPYLLDSPNAIKDLSGNMNYGVNEGGTWDQNVGTLKLDSDSGNSVSAGLVNHNFGNKVSFVLRVKFHKIISGKENTLIGNFEGAGGGIMLSPTGNLFFGVCAETSRQYSFFVTSMVPELEKWYTIVGVYDGTNLLLYVNGQSLQWNSSNTEYPSFNTNIASGNVLASSAPMMIGANPNVDGTSQWGTYADVTYSDVLIFERALTTTEIATDYSGEINPTNTQNLLLHYDFIR